MPSIVVVGAGGLGREAAVLAQAHRAAGGAFDVLGFVDDDPALWHHTVLDLPVLGDIAWLGHHTETMYVLAIGAPRLRRRIATEHSLPTERAATLVHPSVELHSSLRLSPGCLVFRGAVLMLNVVLGKHVVVDVNATVGHDTMLEAFATMHPGSHVSGGAVLEEGVELGTGAVVLPGRRVGRDAIVGAGAVVHRDLPTGCTAVGVPAQPLSGSVEG